MSVYNLWENNEQNAKLKTCLSSEWNTFSNSRSPSPPSRAGDAVFNNDDYLDLIDSRANMASDAKQTDPATEKPFDFYDDEEFAFGISLMNKHIACVGDNFSKLLQTAQEPWPENVKLFQPYEVEQILLPDSASCLAVQAYLKMCNLPFDVEMRWNAEFMSPSGRVPFIKCGAFVVSELEPIVQFVANKGVSLCARLSNEEKAEMRAYMSLITNVLLNAELYISWIDNDTFNTVTKVRNSSVYPWPLGWIQTRSKRNAVAKRLKALHWHDKTLDQVLADVEQCCNSLSQRLGDKEFFFGTCPTPLDALLYGHVRALLSANGPRAGMFIKPITSALLRLVGRITRITGMKLTPQEDYLLNQAFHLSYRRRLSPDRQSDRSVRTMRSRPATNESRESVHGIGYKPFASKKIRIMTNKDGKLTCHVEGKPNAQGDRRYSFISDLLEDVIDKVDETIIDDFARNVEIDFEVIAYPNDKDTDSVSKYGSTIETKYNGLDTIEENEIADLSISIDDGIEDIIQIINEEASGMLDSDGIVTDRHLDTSVARAKYEGDNSEYDDNDPLSITLTDTEDASVQNNRTTITSAGDRKSVTSLRSSRFSPGSTSTLKMPSDEEISVECLLKSLRKRNAIYNYTFSDMVIADID